jgi:hypothetical protein
MKLNIKYIIANIQIPLEINEDGSLKPYLEKQTIDFEICEKLPENNKENHTDLKSSFIAFIKNNRNRIIDETITTNEVPNDLNKTTNKNTKIIKQEIPQQEITITKEELANHSSNSSSSTKKNNSQSFKRRPNNSHRFTNKKYPTIVLPKEDVDPSPPQEV